MGEPSEGEEHVMNIGTYINCHNGTSTFILSSSLSPRLSSGSLSLSLSLRAVAAHLPLALVLSHSDRLTWSWQTWEEGQATAGREKYDTHTVHGGVIITTRHIDFEKMFVNAQLVIFY